MSFHGPEFVLAIIAMSTIGWVFTTFIRARHGYPVEDEWGGRTAKPDDDLAQRNQLLEQENVALRGKVGRLESRLAVVERIVTDAPTRLAAEIEHLK